MEQTRSAAEMEEHLIQAREMEGGNKFVMELQQGFGYKVAFLFLYPTHRNGKSFST